MKASQNYFFLASICASDLFYKNLESLGQSCFSLLETDAKKLDWLKIWPLVKNPEFLFNQPDIQAILPTHHLSISSIFHED